VRESDIINNRRLMEVSEFQVFENIKISTGELVKSLLTHLKLFISFDSVVFVFMFKVELLSGSVGAMRSPLPLI
jgi:hypothetical protein